MREEQLTHTNRAWDIMVWFIILVLRALLLDVL